MEDKMEEEIKQEKPKSILNIIMQILFWLAMFLTGAALVLGYFLYR